MERDRTGIPKGEVILFLDFDGVLHSDWDRAPIPFQRMPLVTDLLRALPHVNVVLTTSWRGTMPIEQLRLHFAEDVRHRVIGATPIINREAADGFVHPLSNASRQAECEAWMWITGRWTNLSKPAWVAVDDRKWWFVVDCPWLVHINPKTALIEADIPRVKDLLEVARLTDLAAPAAPKATAPDKNEPPGTKPHLGTDAGVRIQAHGAGRPLGKTDCPREVPSIS